MGPWVLKFMIVFSVILLQYVKTDVSSGNGGSLQDTDRIDVNSRHKRSYGRSKFRTGKSTTSLLYIDIVKFIVPWCYTFERVENTRLEVRFKINYYDNNNMCYG